MISNREDLIDYLNADRIALGRKNSHPKWNDLIYRYEILLRKCEYYENCKRSLLSKIIGAYYRYRRFKIGTRCGFSIPLNTCGKGLCISHIGPIVISNMAHIGENCRIHICVNIGADARNGSASPYIGDNVYIAPGAKIFGRITIANNIAIGANAVVNKSFVTDGISIAGVPAKEINSKGINGILNEVGEIENENRISTGS